MRKPDKIISAPIAQWIECQPAELKIQVRFLLGAYELKMPVLRRERAFSYTSSSTFPKAKNAKKAKKCIFLVDPVWCTVNTKILLFLVDKSVNIHDFSANYIRTTQIPENFCHTIIISSRRRSIKTTKKIPENYEYTGHSLDTIMAQFFPSQKGIFATFIVTILHTFGHYSKIPKSSDLAKKAK